MTTQHIVTKAHDPEDPSEYTYTLECPGAPHCTGFSECDKPHVHNGIDADEVTPEDGVVDDHGGVPPWDGIYEWTFHGVLHTYHYGYGWTVPYTGCVLREYDLEFDDALLDQPPGRYLISVYWEDPESPMIDDVQPEPGKASA